MDNKDKKRCDYCMEHLEVAYCYVCDGGETKRDQIHFIRPLEELLNTIVLKRAH